MNITPIRSEHDHSAALEEIERLWDALPGSDEEARLELLTLMVEAYEEKLWSAAVCDPIEILQQLIEAGERSQSELATLIGSRSRASEIMARKRSLSLAIIRKISESWNIPAALLIQPYGLTGKAA